MPFPEASLREFAEMTAKKRATSPRQDDAGSKRSQSDVVVPTPSSVASTASRNRIVLLEGELASSKRAEAEREQAFRQEMGLIQEREHQWRHDVARVGSHMQKTLCEAQ